MKIFGFNINLFGPYVYENKKKQKFYLHAKQRGRATIYYFSKDPQGALWALPFGYEVVESPKTNMPFLKKAKGSSIGIFGKKESEKSESASSEAV